MKNLHLFRKIYFKKNHWTVKPLRFYYSEDEVSRLVFVVHASWQHQVKGNEKKSHDVCHLKLDTCASLKLIFRDIS